MKRVPTRPAAAAAAAVAVAAAAPSDAAAAAEESDDDGAPPERKRNRRAVRAYRERKRAAELEAAAEAVAQKERLAVLEAENARLRAILSRIGAFVAVGGGGPALAGLI